VSGVTIKLSGCVYPQDNDGKDFIATTDSNGMAGFYRHPMVVQYCFGSASNLCSWSATKGSEVYTADIQVRHNKVNSSASVSCILAEPSAGQK
jgi:hypothetical protein